ncbi:hypothetical protein [Mycolicibacterium sp.]|jgi:hypothetical protein|uniref:hypothetical protein n=1 Tax=Mycolicibacterium sp. TaxID=2320850 RepID=UPI0037CBE153
MGLTITKTACGSSVMHLGSAIVRVTSGYQCRPQTFMRHGDTLTHLVRRPTGAL